AAHVLGRRRGQLPAVQRGAGPVEHHDRRPAADRPVRRDGELPRPDPAPAHPGARPVSVRVLMVVQRFFPEMGGIETHVAEVASRLAARGAGSADDGELDITVLATDRSGSLPREEVVDGVRVLRRRSWPRSRDYYLSPGVAAVVARGDWDLVH